MKVRSTIDVDMSAFEMPGAGGVHEVELLMLPSTIECDASSSSTRVDY